MKTFDKIRRAILGPTAEEIAAALDRRIEQHVAAAQRRLVDDLWAHLEEDEAAERAESEAWLAKSRAQSAEPPAE